MLLSHRCLLHIVHTYTVALPKTTIKSTTIVKHAYKHTRLSLIWVSLVVMTAVHNIPKQYLSFFFFCLSFVRWS